MTDLEIANSKNPELIDKIAKKLGLNDGDFEKFGNYKAKISASPRPAKGKLILVTSINPTKAGEGKTTVSIGLADALNSLGQKVCLALREPSLGPVFGIKGGATGGGYSQILPMEDINLHFNGDFHAITSANNLLCALIDNHIFQGNQLEIDENKILFHRCLDVNDRALRSVKLGIREENFTITAASEVMAILCMAENLEDLKARLGNIIVAFNKSGQPVFAKDLHAQDAMTILLKDALKPNLVQTLGSTPAIVHCGPFANIAHGCNSVRATKTALGLADYVVTEAGFGADLGAEKFLDFKCRVANLKPDCVVIVATIRALKLHGGASHEKLGQEDLAALKKGYENLKQHMHAIGSVFKLPYVVTLSTFETDTSAEINLLKKLTKSSLIQNEVWAKGGEGGKQLAEEVMKKCKSKNSFSFAYKLNQSVEAKLKDITKKIYGGKGVIFSDKAKEKLKEIENLNLSHLPVIVAKTQYSLSSDPKLLGAPKNFKLEVNDLQIRNGAGFIVAVCGNILLMPALSKNPAAQSMKIDANGKISGWF